MIKELDDYLDIMQEKYPKISRSELKRIIEHGFNIYTALQKKGADVVVGNHRFTAYCGKMFLDDVKRAYYNTIKHRIKLRLQHRYNQEIYNGEYYFGLTEAEFNYYQSQIKSKRRSKIHFRNIQLYKIKEECFLEKSKKHFFKLYYPIDVGWSFNLSEISTRNFEYFAKRDTQNKIVLI